jgi:hypothetical protein
MSISSPPTSPLLNGKYMPWQERVKNGSLASAATKHSDFHTWGSFLLATRRSAEGSFHLDLTNHTRPSSALAS